jgi:5'-nucleotidase
MVRWRAAVSTHAWRWRRLSAGLIVLAAAGAAFASGALRAPISAAPDVVTLSIVGTNDLHGAVAPREGRGGLAVLAGFLENLRASRARDGGAVLLFDGGDMFQGTLESNLNEGAAVVAAYNRLGYTAATIGNHEFDFGPSGERATPREATDDPRGALKARAQEARFPFLAANLIDTNTGEAVRWKNVQPSALIRAGGISVGVVGVTTIGTLRSTTSANTIGLAVAPLAPTIVTQATRLRAEGAAVIVVVAHAGGRCTRFEDPANTSSCEQPSEIGEVASRLPKGLVDVIVAGHTHSGMAHEIAGVAIIEAFASGRAFGRVDLTVTRERPHVISRRIFPPRDVCAREDAKTRRCADPSSNKETVRVQYEGRDVAPDRAVEAVLAPAIEEAGHVKEASLGVHLDTAIRRAHSAESALGNLFADSMLEAVPHADVAITNGGGLRADLRPGALTFGDLYEAMPFDNRLVQLRLTGEELTRVLAANLGASTGILSVAGVVVRARCHEGVLQTTVARRSGDAIRENEELTVVTSDFLATGGDGAFAPVGILRVVDGGDDGPFVRDAIAERLRERGGHLGEHQVFDRSHPRWTYPGDRPVRCHAD